MENHHRHRHHINKSRTPSHYHAHLTNPTLYSSKHLSYPQNIPFLYQKIRYTTPQNIKYQFELSPTQPFTKPQPIHALHTLAAPTTTPIILPYLPTVYTHDNDIWAI